MAKILVIGAGVMGTAITVPAVKNGHDITLVGTPIDNEIIDIIKNSKIHPNLNIELKNTKAINSEELKQDDFDIADVIVIGISSPGIDWFIDLLKRFNAENKNFLIVTKGLYINNQGLIDILPNKIIQNIPYQINITAVTGPCKAIELAQQYITNICFVNEDRSIADKLAKIFIHGFLHLVGFDHIKASEFKKMNKEELKIYNLVKKKF